MNENRLSKATATSIRGDNGKVIIRYHATDVVTFDAYKITLDTGGWRTVTTKRRMNQASEAFGLGYTVYQQSWDWYAVHNGKVYRFSGETLTIPR